MDKPTLLTEEEAADLLGDGADYITYWASVHFVIEDDNGMVQSIQFTEHDSKNEFIITLKQIREAAYRVVNEKLANNSVISDIAQGDYDAVSADVVIQVAALGEVVYG